MTTLYVRLKRKISVNKGSIITLEDVAHLVTDDEHLQMLKEMPIYHITEKDENYVALDGFKIIEHIQQHEKNVMIELLGATEVIIQVQEKEKQMPFFVIAFVWLILFVGTAMTIINFHYDVSMQEVHQKLHFFFTGNNEQYPLVIQIPYSIGLGVGMILFLNHWFNKRFNEEPSPLELELFQYKQRVNEYIAHYENDLNDDDRI